jgi:hypothetical protein
MPGNALYWSHQTTFEATPVSASEARAFVSGHLLDHQLLHLVDPIRLVASELATNALVHAQTAFSVTLAALGETVLLTVRDDSSSVPVRRAGQVLDLAGRGLEIVSIISLEWGTIQAEGVGSKAVWASFAIKEQPEPKPPLAN